MWDTVNSEGAVQFVPKFQHDLHSQYNVLKRWLGKRDSQDAALETQFLWWIAWSHWITNCSLPPSPTHPLPRLRIYYFFFFFVRVKIFLNLFLNLICWMWEGERIFRLKSIHFPSCCALPFPSAGSVIFKILCFAPPSSRHNSACLELIDVPSQPGSQPLCVTDEKLPPYLTKCKHY